MSGSTPAVPPAEGADPSMEDILASIRRILNEDEAGPSKDAAGAKDGAASAIPPTEGEDGVLVLDEAMLVTPPPVQTQEPAPGPQPEPVPEPVAPPGTEPIVAALDAPPVAVVEPPAPPVVAAHAQEIAPRAAEPGLMGPESAAAAASSVGALLRTLATERSTQVHRGGPTIEDLVREEIRPLLKDWLDQHLPPMVERLVRQEIERVAGRVAL
jgi:cell pole-organizing protein PopZ